MTSGGECYNEEIFEIEDFTIVTIKEGLCAELEQLLRKWELSGDNGNSYSITKVWKCKCFFCRILCYKYMFQEALAECQWDSKCDKITCGDKRMIVTHYWPKNLQRIEGIKKSNIINVDASDYFLSNAARLIWSSETDFCSGSIICNQVSHKILRPFGMH